MSAEEESIPEDVLKQSEKKEAPPAQEVGAQGENEGVKRKQGESEAVFLHRIGKEITKKLMERSGPLLDPFRLQEGDLPPDIIAAIEKMVDQVRVSSQDISATMADDEELIQQLQDSIGFHSKAGLKDSNAFDTTERNRKFFEIQPGRGASKRETYWNTLFFPYNTEATRRLAKEQLNDKTIVLLGGGRSKLKKEFSAHGIAPKDIINVDPFVENVEEDADTVISLSASDSSFLEKMRGSGIGKVDEIWAEYSVPAYLEDPQDIKQLIHNIDGLLQEGGTARIWPLEVGGRGEESEKNARKDALQQSIQEIIKTEGYQVTLYDAAGRPGIILHKLAPTAEELQKREDQGKLRELRAKMGLDS